jgi:hypothetical protein
VGEKSEDEGAQSSELGKVYKMKRRNGETKMKAETIDGFCVNSSPANFLSARLNFCATVA